jgi:hypothetical protein
MLDELTKAERAQIRELVYQCANYDRPDRICLLADSMCITLDCMRDITRTAAMCKYFRRAVLPLNPVLEARLTHSEPSNPLEKRVCALCRKEFLPKNNRQQYCSEKCKRQGKKNHDREWRKQQREKAGVNVVI